jgi:pilus assembly protein CpaB
MRNRALVLLLLASLAGVAAAYLAFQFLRNPAGFSTVQAGDPGDLVQVAAAARDLPVGHLVGAEDIRMIGWPAQAVPEGFSRSPAEVAGRGLLTAMAANEPFLPSKLASAEAGGGLSILIPEGKRAMAVRVDDVVGVAGFVVPGTRVDVVVTLNEGTQNNQPVTQLVLQNIQVMASGQSIQRDARGEPQTTTVVTLLVDPEQGEMLGLSATNGRIQLALRNALDADTVATMGARIANLLRRSAPAPVRSSGPVVRQAPQAAPPPSRVQIEVYRGPVRSESTVGPGGL